MEKKIHNDLLTFSLLNSEKRSIIIATTTFSPRVVMRMKNIKSKTVLEVYK